MANFFGDGWAFPGKARLLRGKEVSTWRELVAVGVLYPFN